MNTTKSKNRMPEMSEIRETSASGLSAIRELTATEIDAVTGGKADGTKGAVVQAGWNLAQNKRAA